MNSNSTLVWRKEGDYHWKSERFHALWHDIDSDGCLYIGGHGCCVKKIPCSLEEVEEKLAKISEYCKNNILIKDWKF